MGVSLFKLGVSIMMTMVIMVPVTMLLGIGLFDDERTCCESYLRLRKEGMV